MDIVKKLRTPCGTGSAHVVLMVEEAAREIERLRERLEMTHVWQLMARLVLARRRVSRRGMAGSFWSLPPLTPK